MSVIHVESDEQMVQEVAKAESKIIVVDYFATWCGPCQRVAPVFSQLSSRFKDSVFLKVDVDKCQEVATRQGVSAMPTFHVYRNGNKLEELRGADPVALERMVEKHCNAEATSGNTGGVTSTALVPGYDDMASFIEGPRCECLNESDEHNFRGALTKEGGYLESDCDEQLLLTLAFNQPIKLHSLIVSGPNDGRAPKTIRLFINTTAIDFDNAEKGNSVQDIELTKDEAIAENHVIPLKYVKFQNVNSLTIFVKDNQGDEDTTVVSYIGLIGQSREKTDMNDFKRVAGKKGESHG